MRPNPSLVAFPILLSTLSSALTLDCSHIQVNRKKFDFSKLGGPHSIMVSDDSHPPAIHNMTYTVDICHSLERDKNKNKADQCDHGTRGRWPVVCAVAMLTGAPVCAIDTVYNPHDDTPPSVERVIPVAGNYAGDSGRLLEPSFERLKASDTNSEGLRMTLHGGEYAKRSQVAVIEFQCDPDRTGNEGFEDSGSKMAALSSRWSVDRVGPFAEDGKEESDGKSLIFVSYGASGDNTDVLRLNWKTKYACEDYEGEDEEANKGGRWGFFTWFVIVYVSPPRSSFDRLLTQGQCLPGNRGVLDLRVMAELQSVRRAGMGSTATRRHDPGYSVFVPRLVAEGGGYGARRWAKRGIQRCLTTLCLIARTLYID